MSNTPISLNLAEKNLTLFAHVLPNQKFTIASDFTASIDERYMQGFRRTTDRLFFWSVPASKLSTLECIKLTYESIYIYDYSDRVLVLKSLKNLTECMPITYPNYQELTNFISESLNKFINEFKCCGSKDCLIMECMCKNGLCDCEWVKYHELKRQSNMPLISETISEDNPESAQIHDSYDPNKSITKDQSVEKSEVHITPPENVDIKLLNKEVNIPSEQNSIYVATSNVDAIIEDKKEIPSTKLMIEDKNSDIKESIEIIKPVTEVITPVIEVTKTKISDITIGMSDDETIISPPKEKLHHIIQMEPIPDEVRIDIKDFKSNDKIVTGKTQISDQPAENNCCSGFCYILSEWWSNLKSKK